ncbi:hypothetical protein V6N11_067746 [Hibiscus sabdariffa]|uniref:AP180 N-terminal homology (ANTH) domain-containing protein n=1 Tax=Hibiscus sabdariffa TaxID=183260 RepID=A0ABR2SRR3_9ROSI
MKPWKRALGAIKDKNSVVVVYVSRTNSLRNHHLVVAIKGGTKHEAALMLKVLRKATKQGEELSLFFQFCKEYGVFNASEFPTVTRSLKNLRE